MSYHARSRPIVGRTPDGIGAHYIVVDGYQDDLNIQVVANGTVTFTVDSTLQNILYSTAAQAAVNVGGQTPPEQDRYVDPASAVWTNEIASGSADARDTIVGPVFAIRINITVGTGSVSYHIAQA